jgi:dienelactone hydrolase
MIRPSWCLLLLTTTLALQSGAKAERREMLADAPARTEAVLLGPSGVEVGLLTFPDPVSGRSLTAILLADRDGPWRRSLLYSQRLLENGWALFEPAFDYAGQQAERVPAAQRLAAAVEAMRRDARVDADQLLVVGVGAGARTALEGWAAGTQVSRLVLLYPGCDATLAATARTASPADPLTDVLLMHGDADAANPPEACAELAAAFPPGVSVRQRVLRGSGYGWDAFDVLPPGGRILQGHPAGDGERVVAVPDVTASQIAADWLLGFAATKRRGTR